MKTKKRITLSIYLSLTIFSQLFSQVSESYIGVAQGNNLDAVRESALKNLSQQIQVFVSSKSSYDVRDNNNTYSDSLFSNTVTQSVLALTDVKEKIDTLQKNIFKITKTISKENVKKMFDLRRKKIIDFITEAERLRNEGKIKQSISLQSILDNYYQAYLYAMIYPDTLTYYFTSQSATVLVGIPNAVNEIARSIDFIPVKQVEDDFIVWKYSVRYNGKDVGDLRFSYFDGMGQSDGVVHNGQTQITLYYNAKKEKKERQLQLQLEFLPSEELDNTLSAIKKFLNSSALNKTFSITIPGEKLTAPPAVSVPSSLQELVKARTSFEETKNEIDRLVKKGIIVQGRASDFESLNGLYCAVVDRPGLIALLKNTNNKYYDFLSGKNVELKDFAGYRILWFEVMK